MNRARVFQQVYETNLWGNDFSVSGPGSSLSATTDLRTELPSAIEQLDVRVFLDIPCGDFEWMSAVDLPVEKYVGADIVAPLIDRNRDKFGDHGEFICLDLLKSKLPAADAVFCRDCLVHLSFREIAAALLNIRASKSTYLMTTTFPALGENQDTVTPYWRPINLQRNPFNFPEPLLLIKDFAEGQSNDQGKYIGCWRIDQLPNVRS